MKHKILFLLRITPTLNACNPEVVPGLQHGVLALAEGGELLHQEVVAPVVGGRVLLQREERFLLQHFAPFFL